MKKKDKKYKGFIGATATFKSHKWGVLKVESVSLTDAIDGDLVVYFGAPFDQMSPLIRIHSECVFAEVFKSNFCDCAEQLQIALNRLKREKNGILFYLRMDGRGAGLSAKVKATDLEIQGMDTFESRVVIGVSPDNRDYSCIGDFLKEKGVKKIRLMTNNPDKINGIKQAGIEVQIVPLLVDSCNPNIRKLYKTKADKFHHFIPEMLQNNTNFNQLELDFDFTNKNDNEDE